MSSEEKNVYIKAGEFNVELMAENENRVGFCISFRRADMDSLVAATEYGMTYFGDTQPSVYDGHPTIAMRRSSSTSVTGGIAWSIYRDAPKGAVKASALSTFDLIACVTEW